MWHANLMLIFIIVNRTKDCGLSGKFYKTKSFYYGPSDITLYMLHLPKCRTKIDVTIKTVCPCVCLFYSFSRYRYLFRPFEVPFNLLKIQRREYFYCDCFVFHSMLTFNTSILVKINSNFWSILICRTLRLSK